jgi:GxxExxY protein
MLYQDLTDKIIQAFYTVYNTLGYGFLERVYENAMIFELQASGFEIAKQHKIKVFYKNLVVGEYYADLIVNDTVIIELKATELICKEHEIQLINYLKSTNIELGLLLNFGKKPEFRRIIFSNHRKTRNESIHQQS